MIKNQNDHACGSLLPASDPDISILIPTKNLIHFTERCLLSLFDWIVRDGIAPEKVEILLLDSASEDGLPELIAHYPLWALNLLQFPKSADTNGHKLNYGARRARGRFLLFLDNAIEITSPLIGPLSRVLETQPDIGIVGSKCRLPDGSLENFGLAFTRDGLPAPLYRNAPEAHGFFRKSRKVPAVSCGCAMVRKAEFLTLRGFDRHLLHDYAYADLCLRYLHIFNKASFLEAQSTLIHHEAIDKTLNPSNKSVVLHFQSKWQSTLLPTTDSLYIQDEIANGASDLRPASHSSFSPKKVLIDRRRFLSKMLRGDARTIFFLFDEQPIGLNIEVKELYKYFLRFYSDRYRVLRARPEDFPHFFESEAVTISVASYDKMHFWETRKQAQNDFRVFRACYEVAAGFKAHDYWSEQIRNSQFRLFVSDDYSCNYLQRLGIASDRILAISPALSRDATKAINRCSTRRGRIRYLLDVNSDDISRRQLRSLSSLCEAFSGNRNIELALRDTGHRTETLRQIAARYTGESRIVVHSSPRTRTQEQKLLNSADAVLITEPNETPCRVMEAAAAGVPVLAPIYGSTAEILSMAHCISLPFHLVPVGPCQATNALLLDERYVTSRVSGKDLITVLRNSTPLLRHLRSDAGSKARFLRDRFSMARRARAIEGHISSSRHCISKILEIPKSIDLVHRRISNKPVFSILVNSYNRPGAIIRWLHHLIHLQDFASFPTEVIILDDGSQPSYEAIRDALLRSAASKQCKPFAFRLVRLEHNSGNAIGRNVLIDLARGKRALLMGDDILPIPGMLSRHAEALLNKDSYTLLLGHTEWHPRIRNDLVAEFATKYSGFQFNYESIRNQTDIPLTNIFTSNISFDPNRVRSSGAFFEPVPGVSLFEDTLWGMALDRAGFRLIYDRRAEALHDHDVSYDWLCRRSQIIGSTMYRYFTLFPSSRAFTGIEGRIETVRQALRSSPGGRLSPTRYENKIKNAAHALMPQVLSASSWEIRQNSLLRLHSILYQSFEYHLMKGLISSIPMNDEQKLRAIRFCIDLLTKKSHADLSREKR